MIDRWRHIVRAASAGVFREAPGRAALALLGIALGTALAVAVHAVNASALAEFVGALRAVSGDADLVVRGGRAGFDEAIYARLAARPEVSEASPAIEAGVAVAGRDEPLRVIGLDPLRALRLNPSFAEALAPHVRALLDSDAIVLTQAAAEQLELKAGESLRIIVGTRPVELNVIAVLPRGAYPAAAGIMDIAAAQWRLDRLGTLNRLDLRLVPGANARAVAAALAAELPAGVQVGPPESEAERSASVSRAYRLNLDMLALVALFTGGFLVFSTQVLSVLRRRRELAVLRVLGVTRGGIGALLVAEGAVLGLVGAAAGVGGGYLLAQMVLAHVGADLGAGFFRGSPAAPQLSPGAAAGFLAAGALAAIAGSLAPALGAARRAPAAALRAGDEEESLARLRLPWPGLVLIVAGTALALLPAVGGLPVYGYLAIALLLVGTVTAMPWATALILRPLPAPAAAVGQLATLQLQGNPGRVAISLAAIVTSFSLMVAMATMVHSFRTSLDAWLGEVLPADLYLRVGRTGETGYFTAEDQARLAGVPGVARVSFTRVQSLLLRGDRPATTLLARDIDRDRPQASLPFVSPPRRPGPGEPPPVWVSEIFADTHQVSTGSRVELPLAGGLHSFTVAGVWRDYSRQHGALVVERSRYVALTGDRRANEAALWRTAAAQPAPLKTALRGVLPDASALEIYEAGEIRALSLTIFDRTFAVTYALELVAVLIGLLGVSTGFSAQVLARRAEFGVLRHLGLTRAQIAGMLGLESGLATAAGALVGIALGLAISVILVHVINRQSFHWSMEFAVPWGPIALFAVALCAAAALVAVASGRRALGGEAALAVREDW